MSFSIALQVFLSNQVRESELLHLMGKYNIPLNAFYDINEEMINSGIWYYDHAVPKADDTKQRENDWGIKVSDRVDFDIVCPKSDELLLSYEKGREKLFQLLSDLVNMEGLDLALTIELGETIMLLKDGILLLNPVGVRQKDAQWLRHSYEWKNDL